MGHVLSLRVGHDRRDAGIKPERPLPSVTTATGVPVRPHLAVIFDSQERINAQMIGAVRLHLAVIFDTIGLLLGAAAGAARLHLAVIFDVQNQRHNA